jgi:enoyl-CoA hydratase/carnithine racemase
MLGQLIGHREGRVITAVNSNPGRRNSLSFDFFDEFATLMREAEASGVAAIVLTGADGFFCAGGDMDGLQERAEGTPEVRRSGVNRLNAMILQMRRSPLPVIAAVEGGAAGAGLSIMLACDMVVAARDAFVMAAYVKIGLTPDGGMSAFLTQALPRQLATEMMLTGDRIPVERLYQAGAINRLVEPGEALAQAQALAQRLAEGPAGSMAGIKRLTETAAHPHLEDQLEREAESICDALGGAEGHEGIAAFKGKRKPEWPR